MFGSGTVKTVTDFVNFNLGAVLLQVCGGSFTEVS